MIYEFSINKTKYFFDGTSLELYKDYLPEKEKGSIPLFTCTPNILGTALILVSELCNGRCQYCYQREQKTYFQSSIMDKKSAEQIIHFLTTNYSEINTVSFFGGEPLLNYKIMQFIVENLQKQMSVKNYEITTNAILIDERMIQFFIRYNFKVIISIDGPPQIHNYLRIGCPHNKVIEVIQKLKNSPIKDRIVLNCTYTKYHTENISYNELLKYFENIGMRYSISEVFTNKKSFNLVGKKITEQEKISQIYENLCNFPLNESSNEYVTPVITALVEKIGNPFFCAGLGNNSQILFDSKGKQYPCISLLYKYGANDNRINVYNEKKNKFCS